MKTLLHFFNQNVARFAGNIYLWEHNGEGYAGTTYGEVGKQVHCFAAGLMESGIEKGDRIALLSEARNAWVICEFGILMAGGVNVPLSVRINEPEELIFRINHSGARMIIVSSLQLSKIRAIRSQVPCVETIVVLDQSVSYEEGEIGYSEIHKRGAVILQEKPGFTMERAAMVMQDDIANISYTSGTTADPKGIILTHRNYFTNIEQGYSLMDITSDYVTLLILPWDHAFAHTAGIYCFMGKGASIASVQVGKTPLETLKNLPKNIWEIKPYLLFSVPAIARNFRKGIEKSVRDQGPVVSKLFSFALKISYLYNGKGWDKGKGVRSLLKPLVSLFDHFFYRKIRDGFGGRLEFFIGGGALLDVDFQYFFYAIGIPMMQGYGLTEASPFISSNAISRHKLGSSGFLVANLDLKICDDKGNELSVEQKGEIVVRGENVMAGYWKNEEATLSTLRDGWLHTGDMGYMDKDGFLYVLGRFKSLLIADDGEKYSPEGMEEAFAAQSAFIEQCMLYNNQDPYTVILVVPAREAIHRFLREKGIASGAAEAPAAVLLKIDQEIQEYRSGKKYGSMFPQRWLPAAIGILEEPFTEENHMLNFQLKTVRGRVIEKYQHKIKFLYTPAAKNISNGSNVDAIKSILKEG